MELLTKPGFHIVFVGLSGSFRVAGFAQSLSVILRSLRGLSGSPRVFYFVFAEGLSGSLE